MKLILAAFTAVLSLVNANATPGNDTKVSASVLSAFSTSFRNAAEVKWNTAGNYYKADFVVNGQYATAFYDEAATLVAVTRNINSLQLPVTLQTKLKASYEGYWITDLFELSDEDGVSYYVALENADGKIVLKSSGSSWSVYKKESKA